MFKVLNMSQPQLLTLPLRAAVLHFGRKPDGYGGRAALARALGISQSALNRWKGPNLPQHHARALLKAPYNCRHLLKGKR